MRSMSDILLLCTYYTSMYVSIVESDDSDNEASSSKKKKKNSCTLVWEVSEYNYCILLYTLVYYCLVLLYTIGCMVLAVVVQYCGTIIVNY